MALVTILVLLVLGSNLVVGIAVVDGCLPSVLRTTWAVVVGLLVCARLSVWCTVAVKLSASTLRLPWSRC